MYVARRYLQSSEVISSGDKGVFGHFGLFASAWFHYSTSTLSHITCVRKQSFGEKICRLAVYKEWSAGGVDFQRRESLSHSDKMEQKVHGKFTYLELEGWMRLAQARRGGGNSRERGNIVTCPALPRSQFLEICSLSNMYSFGSIPVRK